MLILLVVCLIIRSSGCERSLRSKMLNFAASNGRHLGGLNDIYAQSITLHQIIPPRRYDAPISDQFHPDRTQLKLFPHYFAHGLVTITPDSLISLLPGLQSRSKFQEATKVYKEFLARQDERLTYQEKGGAFKQKYDALTKRYIIPTICMATIHKHYHLVPHAYSLTVFGNVIGACYLPEWLTERDLEGILPPSSDTRKCRLQQLLEKLLPPSDHCPQYSGPQFSVPPTLINDARQTENWNNPNNLLTRPLKLSFRLREKPLNQLLVLASIVVQCRNALGLDFSPNSLKLKPHNLENTSEVLYEKTPITHLSDAIVCLPCGSGKTYIAAAFVAMLFSPIFDALQDNDFGKLVHLDDFAETDAIKSLPTTSNATIKRTINDFFKQSGKSSSAKPTPSGPKSMSADQWLKQVENMNPYAQNHPLRSLPTLFLVHGSDLIDQTIRNIKTYLPKIRIKKLQAKLRPDPVQCDFVVASTDTIAEQTFPVDYFDRFKILICDEAHQNMALFFQSALVKLSQIPFKLFMTATPRNPAMYNLMGPVLVYATRPFVPQHHAVIILGGVDPFVRPQLEKVQRWINKNATNKPKPSPDKTSMFQNMIMNMERSRLILECIMSTCVIGHHACFPSSSSTNEFKYLEVTNSWSPDTEYGKHQWKDFFDTVYENRESARIVKTINDFLNPTTTPFSSPLLQSGNAKLKFVPKINGHKRVGAKVVPIIFSSSVQHLILLQHWFAWQWIQKLKASNPEKYAHVELVRIGLRQLAAVDMSQLTSDQKAYFRSIGDEDKIGSTWSGLDDRAHDGIFDDSFWLTWFEKYPLCKRLAELKKNKWPFSDKACDKRAKGAKRNASGELKEDSDDNDLASGYLSVEKAKDSSAWTYYSHFFWTKTFWPIPKAVSRRKGSHSSEEGTRKKSSKKRKLSEEETEEVSPIEDEQDEDIEQVLIDERPKLEHGRQVLATFGLLIGKESLPAPGPWLTTKGSVICKTPHNDEALSSDYIFANYAVAGTGIDRDDICVTVMAGPIRDAEQPMGRALRIKEGKQEILHLEFAEPYSIFKGQTLSHMEAMLEQKVISQVYVAIK